MHVYIFAHFHPPPGTKPAAGFPLSQGGYHSFLMEPKEETGRAGQEHDIGPEDYVKIYRLQNELAGKETVDFPEEKLPPFGGPYHRTDRCGMTCNAGMIFFTIEWDGKMYACNSIREIWAEPMKDGFPAAWDSIHKAVLRWPAVPECVECPYESVCTNCPAEKARFAQPGKPPLKLCEKTRYLVQHGVRTLPACD
jgi:radical SAM protein with 4Fe4S-binding SPASM domain